MTRLPYLAALLVACASPRSIPLDPDAGLTPEGPDENMVGIPIMIPTAPDARAPVLSTPAYPDAHPDAPASLPDAGPDAAVDSPPDAPAQAPDAPPPPPPPPRPDAAPEPPPPPPPCGGPCKGGRTCRDGECRCPLGELFCLETNRCHVPVICLVEYDPGSLNLAAQRLTSFCPASPGGAAHPEANGVVRPGQWAPADDDGACDAFVKKATAALCGGGPPGKRLGLRRLSYDTMTGALEAATPTLGPVCP